MEINDLFQPFTEEQKIKSFLLTQDFILDKQQKNEIFLLDAYLEMSRHYVVKFYLTNLYKIIHI